MSEGLFLLSREFISSRFLKPDIERIAKQLGLNYREVEDSQVTISQPGFGDTIEIHFVSEAKWQEMKEDETFLKGYSCIFYTIVYSKADYDNTSIPFLKEFLKYHPELLVYNEETPPANEPYVVFSKKHIDGFMGSESSLFSKKPSE